MPEPLTFDTPDDLPALPPPSWRVWALALAGSTAAALMPFAGLWVGL